MKIYKNVDRLPSGRAKGGITQGCLVLEGGGWKGLYTVGVLDCLMMHGINISTVVGVSAGALSAVGYVSRQIGWGARIDLKYRHDTNYCGLGAMRRDHGVTGFSYLFGELLERTPIDMETFRSPERRLIVSATNMLTGKAEYFERDKCDIFKAIQASATVPYVSAPVMIDSVPYLDGGCAEKIPYTWAKHSGEKKIMVVRTRELTYRRKPGTPVTAKLMYSKYPKFLHSIETANDKFNAMVDELEMESKVGNIILLAPSKPVTVSRFEGNMDKLGALYILGFKDTKKRIGEIKEYFGI